MLRWHLHAPLIVKTKAGEKSQEVFCSKILIVDILIEDILNTSNKKAVPPFLTQDCFVRENILFILILIS